MDLKPEENEFWTRVDHEMRMREPMTWRMTQWMLRFGMASVLFSAGYLLIRYLLTPPKGYFLSQVEVFVHPLVWALIGVLSIIGGAYLRFRAMGPIVERLKERGFD